MTLRVGSLFSGIGGMDLGLELAGFRTAWQCEIDPWRRAVLAQHWPDIPRYDDVSTLTLSPAALPAVDVICGGFPCQDASVANAAGLGIKGARTGLWFRMLDIIQAVRPVGVIGENVPGLLRRGLDVACRGLQDAGYEVEATRLRASDLGFSHRRERVVIVAVAHAYLQRRDRWAWAGGEHDGRAQPAVGGEHVAYSDGGGWRADVEHVREGQQHAARRGQAGLADPNHVGRYEDVRRERDPTGRALADHSSPSALADPRRQPSQRGGEPGDLRGAPGGAEGAGQERERLRDAARGGGAPGVADADGERQPQPQGSLTGKRGWTGDSGAGAAAMGHSALYGLRQAAHERPGAPGSDGIQPRPHGGVGPMRASTEPRLGGAPHGLPEWVDRRCAGRGEAQYPEEPPRTAARRRGDGSAQRVSGLGNAFVPLCAYVAGMRLLERLKPAAP